MSPFKFIVNLSKQLHHFQNMSWTKRFFLAFSCFLWELSLQADKTCRDTQKLNFLDHFVFGIGVVLFKQMCTKDNCRDSIYAIHFFYLWSFFSLWLHQGVTKDLKKVINPFIYLIFSKHNLHKKCSEKISLCHFGRLMVVLSSSTFGKGGCIMSSICWAISLEYAVVISSRGES